MNDTIIIGYGNPLRGDDGVGWEASQRLREQAVERVEVVTCHQLLPELAEPLSQARQAIFIDASVTGTPGEIVARPVEATSEPGHSLTHHLSAASLLALARALYGRCPQATLFSVTGTSFEHGEGLTPVVMAALPALIEQVVRLIVAGEREATCTSTP